MGEECYVETVKELPREQGVSINRTKAKATERKIRAEDFVRVCRRLKEFPGVLQSHFRVIIQYTCNLLNPLAENQ